MFNRCVDVDRSHSLSVNETNGDDESDEMREIDKERCQTDILMASHTS